MVIPTSEGEEAMRTAMLWKAAAILAACGSGFYLWGTALNAAGEPAAAACRSNTNSILSGIGCMNWDGMTQALAGLAFLGAASIPASVALWRRWRARRAAETEPVEPRDIDKELADIDRELAALSRRDS